MRAARITNPKQPLGLKQLETLKPKGSRVLIKVQAAGVFHSDIHLWEGGYKRPEGQFLETTDRGVKFSLTPGHEIAGTIESLGEKAEGFKKNDKVLVFP